MWSSAVNTSLQIGSNLLLEGPVNGKASSIDFQIESKSYNWRDSAGTSSHLESRVPNFAAERLRFPVVCFSHDTPGIEGSRYPEPQFGLVKTNSTLQSVFGEAPHLGLWNVGNQICVDLDQAIEESKGFGHPFPFFSYLNFPSYHQVPSYCGSQHVLTLTWLLN